jgi:DNA-binding SARP family transcriptional activator
MGEASLQMRLLGALELTRGDAPLSVTSSLRVRSLLAYLISRRGHFVYRDLLVSLFWPNRPNDRARCAFFHR